MVSKTFQRFSCYYNIPENVTKANTILNERFAKQIDKYRQRFPRVSAYNVRFTRDELDVYF